MKASELSKLADILGERSFADIAVITGSSSYDIVSDLGDNRVSDILKGQSSIAQDPISWFALLKESELETLAEVCTEEGRWISKTLQRM